MAKKQAKQEFKRYTLVGVVATAIDYGLLNLLTHIFQVPLVLANLFSASSSSLFSYVLNRKVVFKDKAHSEKRTVLLYAASLIFGIVVIQTAILWLIGGSIVGNVLSFIGIKGSINTLLVPNIAKLIAGVATYAWNFLTQRKFVFVSHDPAHN